MTDIKDIKAIDIRLKDVTNLRCKEALEISDELGVLPADVGKAATDANIRIKECLFSEFGKQQESNHQTDIDSLDIELFEILKPYMDIHRRVDCKDLLSLSKDYGVESIRECLKEFDIRVKNCSLGFFKEKSDKKLFLKVKTWVEDECGNTVFSKESNDSLDMIAKTGSIKKASEILDINYKKCWLNLKSFEKSMGEKIALSKRGSGEDAGTIMNKKALDWIDKYKRFQRAVNEFSNEKFNEIFFDNKSNKKE